MKKLPKSLKKDKTLYTHIKNTLGGVSGYDTYKLANPLDIAYAKTKMNYLIRKEYQAVKRKYKKLPRYTSLPKRAMANLTKHIGEDPINYLKRKKTIQSEFDIPFSLKPNIAKNIEVNSQPIQNIQISKKQRQPVFW